VISAQNWDNDQAQLLAGRSLQLSLHSGSDRGGTIAAGLADPSSGAVHLGDLLIDSKGAFDNSNGTLSASRHVILQSTDFNNAGGKITASTGDLAWIINGALNNTGASVQVCQNLEVSTGGNLNNTSGHFYVTGDSQYAVLGALTNQGGSIVTGNNLALDAVALNNRSGSISAGTDIAQFNIQKDVDNTAGTIAAGGLFQGKIGGTFTQGGWLAGNGQVALEVQNLANTGRIVSAGEVDILAGNLTNQGAIQGDLGVVLGSTTASFSTGSTIESYYGPVQIAIDSALTNQGTITTNQNIVLELGGAFINQGNIVAGNNIQIVAAGQIENDQLVSAGRDLQVSAADARGNLYQIINKGGSFIAGNDDRFDTSYFTNTTSGGVAIDTGWQHYASLSVWNPCRQMGRYVQGLQGHACLHAQLCLSALL
jgi:filamentous hemagglutinin